MNMRERTNAAAKAIRAELRELGYTARQVGVTTGYASCMTSVDLTVKDATVDWAAVKALASKYADIHNGHSLYVNAYKSDSLIPALVSAR